MVARGFSLIELLCVLVIIAVLVGLSLPAVQGIRETSRRVSCQNKLRQITLAAHAFEAAFDRLPPGTLGMDAIPTLDQPEYFDWFGDPSNTWRKYQNTSALVLLLPHMGADTLYDSLPKVTWAIGQTWEAFRLANPGQPEWIGDVPEVEAAMQTRVAMLECPDDQASSESIYGILGSTQPVTFQSIDGTSFRDKLGVAYIPPERNLMPGNYVGCAGAHSGGETSDPDRRPYTGVMSCRARKTLSGIRDGTSHTIMFGETVGWIDAGKRRAIVPWFFGGLARGYNHWGWKQGPKLHNGLTFDLLGDALWSTYWGFGSKHNVVVNFGFSDGSVRPISRRIDWPAFYSLCGAADGGISTGFD